jgi:ribonucleoside-diphosphate reductase alpha chain
MNSEYIWLNEASQAFLERDYLLPGQTVDDRIKGIAEYAEDILEIDGFADKFVSYVKKGWYSLSTPVWTNFGTHRGSGISCFGSYVEDSMESILYTDAEVGMMSKKGGGTSAYFGALRHRGAPIKHNGESSGAVHFEGMFDYKSNIVSQGKTRRGSFAGYLPIDHPDIMEHLQIKSDGFPIQDMSFGITVSDEWLEAMDKGDVDKRTVWAKVLEVKFNTGYPYIFFTDTMNNNTVDVYKDKAMKIHASNLCTEIALPSSKDESFVCCLSSMNLLYYHDWKKTDAVETMVYFLDAVLTDFIRKNKDVMFMERAVRFAERHRAIGIGVFGWHSFLQSQMIAFESLIAKMCNHVVFKDIQEQSLAASAKMAVEYGEPVLLKGYGRRHTCVNAIAPTTSSAFIIGQASQSTEPYMANYYIKDLAKIKYTVKNPYLKALLEDKGEDTVEVWQSILMKGGSVQHLDFLTENEKAVFKTFGEISQKEIIIQASQRQKYIDQAQSINLMVHPDTPTKDLNELMLYAWRSGVKSLYYQHSLNAAQEFSRNLLTCVSCEA